MELLMVEGLSKSFGGLSVLKNISFTIHTGEKVGIIGPNGAGKTTLINIMSGVLPPSGGQIYVRGKPATKTTPYKFCRLGISRSFQLNTLFLNISLLDNVLIASKGKQLSWLKMMGPVNERHYRAKAQELLEMVGLWEKRKVFPKALSYGEQRLVEVVLALASEPSLLLLDEPSAGLSTAEVHQVLGLLGNLPEDMTLFFCAHDMSLLFALASRVVVLHHGELIAEGTPEEIKANLRVREIYLGGS